jgi:uncharacterized membrane protein
MSRSLSLLGACIGALALCACSKQESPAPASAPVSDPAPIPAATAPVGPPVEPPAESSLALKRGMLSLATERATFQPCGEQTPLWVLDQTDGVLRETFANEPKPLELYVEAHGERTPVPTEIEAARAYPGAFILEEVLYATPPGESQGCKQPAPTYIVIARGNEPFWSIEVVEGKLIWRQPEAPQELVIEALQAEDAEGTVGYSGSAQGHALELFVEAQPCRDSMSGAYFAYSARATFDGKALKGCARIGE